MEIGSMASKEVVCPHCGEVNVFTQIYVTTWVTRFPDEENHSIVLGCHDELHLALDTIFKNIEGFKKSYPQLPPAEVSTYVNEMHHNIVSITTEVLVDKDDKIMHLGDFKVTEVTLKTKTSHVH
jgi:phage FluMu protein Com